MIQPRSSALVTGLACMILATAACSGSSDGAKDTAAAPAPSQPAAPFDCTKLMTKQDAENVLKKTVAPNSTRNSPPKTCAYSADRAVVAIEQLSEFPPAAGKRESFEGHDARRMDRFGKTAMCDLFIDLGYRGGGFLGVVVSDVKDTGLCGIADKIAHLALARLAHEQP